MSSTQIDTRWGKATILRGREVATQRPRGIAIIDRTPTSTANFRYEHPDLDDDPTEDHFMLRDLSLGKRIAETVERVFPLARYMIDVRIEVEQGIVEVKLKHLMNRQSYICHVRDLECDPQLRQLVNGIGELLERYGFSRSRETEREALIEAIDRHQPWLRRADEVPGGNYSNKRV